MSRSSISGGSRPFILGGARCEPGASVAAFLVGTLLLITGCANSVPGQPQPAAAPATTTSAAAAPTGTGRTPESSRLDIELVEQGFTAWEDETGRSRISYSAVIRNPNPDTWATDRVDVTVSFSDVSGAVIEVDDLAGVFAMRPGDTAAVVTSIGLGPEITAGAVSMQVDVEEPEWVETADLTPGEITFGPAVVRPGTSRPDQPGLLISCDAMSTFSSVQKGSINTVYRDATGTILGGSSHSFDSTMNPVLVPGGATTPIELFEYVPPPPSVPTAECYSNFLAQR